MFFLCVCERVCVCEKKPIDHGPAKIVHLIKQTELRLTHLSLAVDIVLQMNYCTSVIRTVNVR